MIKLMSLDKKSSEALLPFADSRGFLPERGDDSQYFRYLNPIENWSDWVSQVCEAFRIATAHLSQEKIHGDGKKAFYMSPETRLVKCFCGAMESWDPRGSKLILGPGLFVDWSAGH